MSLKTLFKDEMDNLLSVTDPYLDDLPVTISFTQEFEPGDYDPVTDTVDEGSNVIGNVKGMLGPFTRQQLTLFDTAPGDVRFKFSFKSVNFTPEIGDTLVSGSTTYTVIATRLNSSESVWTLQLRE